LQTEETWPLKVRFESKVTPRVVIWSDIGTEELAVWIPTGIGKELRRCRVPSNMASDLAGFSARPDSHSCLQNSLQEGFHSQEFGKDAAIPKIPRCLGVAHRDCHRRRIRRRPTSHYSGIISTNHSHSVGSRSANIACTMSLYCATTVLSRRSHKQNTLHYITLHKIVFRVPKITKDR